MKKIIIVRTADDAQIYAAADAFTRISLSVTICDKDELPEVMDQEDADAVFSFRFDDDLSELCSKKEIPCIFWILTLPAPEIFSARFFDENNHIFIPDRELYELFRKMGHTRIYYAEIPDEYIQSCVDGKKAKLLFDRIVLHLEDDERMFLRGLFRAQEVCPDRKILFRAIGDDLIIKMYSYAGFPDGDVLIKKRYVISECILRTVSGKRSL